MQQTMPRERARRTTSEAPGAPGDLPPSNGYGPWQWAGLGGGLALFVLLLLLPAPAGLAAAGWHAAAVGVLMAVWWITEAAPIPATAMLPLVLFPILGIQDIRASAAPYANPLIFLFMGGFIIALGMQRWGLHRRIALNIIRHIGTQPRAIIAGFMVSSAFLSMWVSNTATAMMMLPIGLSVVELVRMPGAPSGAPSGTAEGRNFGIVLMLAIAYASSVGGMATLIGTPTNAFLVGFLAETYGFEISFARWMLFGLPLMLLGLVIMHFVLTRLVYPIRLKTLPGGRALIREELGRLGAMTKPEKMVAAVFSLVALLWMTGPLLQQVMPGISDAGIAIFGAVLLFVLPVRPREGLFILDWEHAEKLPWGVLLLFGGGLSLAAAIQATGLAAWIGGELGGISAWPLLLVILIVTAVVILLTELTSNTATAAAFLPVLASVAVGVGQNPLLFVIPATLAASCAFMLPVATPPNAIVYGSGALTIGQMARAGLVLNVVFVGLITALTYSLLFLIFDVTPGVVPPWAAAAP